MSSPVDAHAAPAGISVLTASKGPKTAQNRPRATPAGMVLMPREPSAMPAFLNAHTLPYNLTDSHLETRRDCTRYSFDKLVQPSNP